jgi:hypothetical protein
MANMNVNQRNQFDRVELSVPTTGVRVQSRVPLMIYLAVATVLLVALSYAAIAVIDGWAQVIVLAMIVVTVIGGMIAISPSRRW